MRGRNSKAGFTLIEVMISLGILAFGILGLMAGQIASMRFSEDSREHTLAMKLAEEQMETLQAMTPGDVLALLLDPNYPNDPDNPIDPDPNDDYQVAFNRRTQVADDSPEAGMMTLTVEVDFLNALGAWQTARVQSFKVSP